jgi:uncharacterized protein (DUF885 family)
MIRSRPWSTPLLALSTVLLLIACSREASPPAASTASPSPAAAATPGAEADARFVDLGKRWLDGVMKVSPISATQIGDHRYDAEIDDLGTEARAKGLEFVRSILADLDAIDAATLSRENRIDAAILRNQLRYDIWASETLQSWAWDPTLYSQLAGGALYTLMAREFAPLPERLNNAAARMEKLPKLLAQMRANLDPARVPSIHAETAAKQNPGILSIVDGLILPQAGELAEADRQRLDAAIAGLRAAVAEHQAWLDETLVPNAKGEFRIGAALYDSKLAFALNSPLSRAEIRSRADAELSRVRAEMYQIARGVLAGRPNPPALPDSPDAAQQQAAIEAALELAYADKPARDQIVEAAKQSLIVATDFVKSKDLVAIPDAPVEIILMPEFQRGVSFAYCDSPGPLDKGQKTFYAVSPIPDDWSAEQVDSFLREYNTRSIHELTLHEATPGHYLQLWHSNRYPSTLRAVLSSGPFVEGWAVYIEKILIDAGYLDDDPLMSLINLKWYLRGVANAILDQAIHVDGMSRDDAMKLMTVDTFQQEREAAGKWVRAQLTSAQLPTYFVGAQEHFDLRGAMKEKWAADFSERRYHDTVLSFGSPPVRYVRALMLDEPIK